MAELVSGGINKWLMFQSWISFQILQKIWIRMICRMAFEICKKWFKRKYQSPAFAWVKAGEKDPFISKQAQCACTFNFQLTVKNEVDLWTLTAVWRQPFTWNDCQLLCHILTFPLQLKSSNFYKSQVYPSWHQVFVPLCLHPVWGTACAAAALPSSCGTGLCREFTFKLGKYPFSYSFQEENKKMFNQFGL